MGTTLWLLEAAATVLVAHLVLTYLTSPVKHIPGPLLAKFTNLWRFFNVWGGESQHSQTKMHERHGSLVAIGPNCVTTNDANLIRTIYTVRNPWLKVCRFLY